MKYKNMEDLPLGLKVKDIMEVLNISKNCAYELVNSEAFPSLRIGKSIIILRDDFLDWLKAQTQVEKTSQL